VSRTSRGPLKLRHGQPRARSEVERRAGHPRHAFNAIRHVAPLLGRRGRGGGAYATVCCARADAVDSGASRGLMLGAGFGARRPLPAAATSGVRMGMHGASDDGAQGPGAGGTAARPRCRPIIRVLRTPAMSRPRHPRCPINDAPPAVLPLDEAHRERRDLGPAQPAAEQYGTALAQPAGASKYRAPAVRCLSPRPPTGG
jgi:hypothetical protein